MILTVTSKQAKNGSVKIVSIKLRCDACSAEYESKRRSRDINRTTHWCSRSCFGVGMQSGGLIRVLAEQTWVSRWGTVRPSQHPDVEAKRRATSLKKFGSVSPMQVEEHKKLRRKNNVEKYGVENVIQIAAVKTKRIETFMKRYGVKSALAIPEVYARVNWQEAVRKNHESMKRNNSYRKSKAEDRMHELLVELFGVNDIERQHKPIGTNWPIDFYVKSIDVWIQVDGVYWHGLDRPLEEHIKSGSPRSESIIGKWHVDRAQEHWFAKHNMKLLRITDKESLTMTSAALVSLLTIKFESKDVFA